MKPTASTSHTIESHLKSLHLPAIRSCYAEFAEKAVSEGLSYEDYLLELLEQETHTRRMNRQQRWLHESKLPLEKCFDTFDLKRLSLPENAKIKVLREGDFLARKENILVFGNPGSGKSHLLCAIGRELIEKDHRVLYTKCSMLVETLLNARRELKLERLLKRLAKYEALILDDIGYIQQGREEMEVLFTLLAQRYERGSLMITSNLPFSKWERIFKDKMTTAAAIDRLIHHSVILELNIPSFRMEQAKKRKK